MAFSKQAVRGRKEEKRCKEETTVDEGCVGPWRDRSHRGNCWLMALLVYSDLRREALVGPAAKDATFLAAPLRSFHLRWSAATLRDSPPFTQTTQAKSRSICAAR